MANEFIARKGLKVLTGGASITGNLAVNTTISASFISGGYFNGNGAGITGIITASYAETASAATSITFVPLTASYAETAGTTGGGVTGNGVINRLAVWSGLSSLTSSVIDAFETYTTTAFPFTASAFKGDGAGITGIISASFAETDWSTVHNKPTGLVSSSTQIGMGIVSSSTQISYTGITDIPVGILSSSAQFNALSDTSASYASTVMWSGVNNKPVGIVSSSTQLPTGLVSASAQISYTGITDIPVGIVSASSQVSYTGLSNIPVGIYSSSAQLPTGIVSASSQVSYTGLSNVPVGILSSSAQFNALSDTSASYAATTIWSGVNNKPDGIVSSSTQLPTGIYSSSAQLPTGIVSSSAQVSYTGLSSIPVGIVSSSTQIPLVASATLALGVSASAVVGTVTSASYAGTDWGAINNKPTVVSSSTQISYTGLADIPTGIVSSSAQTVALISGQTISPTAISASDVYVAGTLTAKEIHSVYVSSSIIYESGSTKFGDSIDDTMSVTGTLAVSGTVNFLGPITFQGGLGPTTIAGALYTTGSQTVNIGTTVVTTVATSSYDMAHFKYVVKNGINLRTGVVMSVWSASVIEYTDTSTNDIGDTTDISFVVDVLGENARLKATVGSINGWVVKTIVNAI